MKEKPILDKTLYGRFGDGTTCRITVYPWGKDCEVATVALTGDVPVRRILPPDQAQLWVDMWIQKRLEEGWKEQA